MVEVVVLVVAVDKNSVLTAAASHFCAFNNLCWTGTSHGIQYSVSVAVQDAEEGSEWGRKCVVVMW